MTTRALTHAARRTPGLKRLPVLKLLALAEIGLIARDHFTHLDPWERRRLVALVRKGKGRTSALSPGERDELAGLAAKLEPRRFAGLAADRLSPVPLPRRLVHGPARRTRTSASGR
jgi:hypothetical protein